MKVWKNLCIILCCCNSSSCNLEVVFSTTHLCFCMSTLCLLHEFQVLSFFLLNLVTLSFCENLVVYLYCNLRKINVTIGQFKMQNCMFISYSYYFYFPKHKILLGALNIWWPHWGYITKIYGFIILILMYLFGNICSTRKWYFLCKMIILFCFSVQLILKYPKP